jgi:hypothetical protein
MIEHTCRKMHRSIVQCGLLKEEMQQRAHRLFIDLIDRIIAEYQTTKEKTTLHGSAGLIVDERGCQRTDVVFRCVGQ